MTTISTFDEVFALFPTAQDTVRVRLTRIYLWIQVLTFKCLNLEFYIAIFGVFFTIFHLTILLQKPMRTSSVMSILISTAICDLISMIEAVSVRDIILRMDPKECLPPVSLPLFYIFQVLQSVRDDVIRCSTWLSVSMALIRYLVLRVAVKGGSGRISSFKCGFQVFLWSLTLSTCFSVFYGFRVKIVQIGVYTPAEYCEGLEVAPIYESHASDLFLAHNGLILRIFMFSNGIVSKILPCLLFPILTGLLILELRTAQENRKGSNVSASKNNTERTTGLVIFMTVAFFIALLPSGIMTSLQAVYTDEGFLYLGTYIDHICYTLLTLNATLHCFICFAMSSQYRKTVRNLFRINMKPKQSVANSIAPTVRIQNP